MIQKEKIVKNVSIQTERPSKLTNRWLCYWAAKEGILIGNMKSKAMNFIENECIQPAGKDWICLPIEGYNSTEYSMNLEKETCTCQYNTRFNNECSHLKALKLYLFREKWNA